MVSKSSLRLVCLVVAAVMVQVLLADVRCTPIAGGSTQACETMSASKALMDADSDQQASGETELRTAVFSKTQRREVPGCYGAQQGVKNLSVAVFPANSRLEKFSMLIQWRQDAAASHEIAVRKSSTQVFYNVRTDPGVSSVLLESVYWYRAKNSQSSLQLFIDVKTLSTGGCTTVSVDVGKDCEAFVYNQHCSQRVDQSIVDTSEVSVHTSLLPEESPQPQHMSLMLSWQSMPGLSVMIALNKEGQTATDCNRPGRDPPCFVASNTSSVTIAPLNSSIQYEIFLHSFNPSACRHHPYLSYMFNGCVERCCSDSSLLLPHPTNMTPTPVTQVPQQHHALTSSLEPQTSHTPQPTPLPQSPDTPSQGTPLKPSQGSHTVSRAADTSNYLLAVTIVVPLVVVVVTLSAVAALVIGCKIHWRRKPTPPCVIPVVRITPPSVTEPSEILPVSKWPSVLVLYSESTPVAEKDNILTLLVGGLRLHEVDAKAPDTRDRDSGISFWLEKEIESSVVLLVCNSALKSDWVSERPSRLVCALKQLLHGHIVEQKLSKFATVFIGSEIDASYIPSTYLMPQNQFTVRDAEDVTNIAYFVYQVPLYTCTTSL